MKTFLMIALLLLSYIMMICNPPFDHELSRRLDKSAMYAKLGGCGYEALYIKQYLDKKGIPSNIVIFGNHAHCMVLSNGSYIDKHGFFSLYHPIGYIYDPYIISLDSLQRLCNNPNVWNKKFNRADTAIMKQILLE